MYIYAYIMHICAYTYINLIDVGHRHNCSMQPERLKKKNIACGARLLAAHALIFLIFLIFINMCPLCMCPHTTNVSSYYYMCPHTAAIYVSSTTICVLILVLSMCPHTTICVLILLLYMCPHTTISI